MDKIKEKKAKATATTVIPKSKGIMKKKDKPQKEVKVKEVDPAKKVYPGHKITEDHEDKKPKSWNFSKSSDKKKKKGVQWDVPKAFQCSVSYIVQLDS